MSDSAFCEASRQQTPPLPPSPPSACAYCGARPLFLPPAPSGMYWTVELRTHDAVFDFTEQRADIMAKLVYRLPSRVEAVSDSVVAEKVRTFAGQPAYRLPGGTVVTIECWEGVSTEARQAIIDRDAELGEIS